jgi:hypothetical protein
MSLYLVGPHAEGSFVDVFGGLFYELMELCLIVYFSSASPCFLSTMKS